MNRGHAARRARDRKMNRLLLAVFVAILFFGMISQVTMLARISGQSKASRAVEKEIRVLMASQDNLNLSLNQFHNLDRIAAQAQRLGMEQPKDSQIRVVNLPGAVEDTSTQSAEILSAEEMMD